MLVTGAGGSIEKEEKWGNRKLAYRVNSSGGKEYDKQVAKKVEALMDQARAESLLKNEKLGQEL